MNKPIYLKRSSFLSLILFFTFLAITPKEGKACIDPDTVITVTTNYNSEFTEVVIILGNLKLMTEQPNVFCSCALGGYTDFFTHLEYVAFVEAGTTIPYQNMDPWENTASADDAWDNSQPIPGNWSGFIAEVINNGLAPQDDVELIIRASTPPGFFVSVGDLDSTLVLSYLGTDAWDPINEELFEAHQGVRNLGINNSSSVFVEKADSYFTELDEAIISKTTEPQNLISISVSPNPSYGSFYLDYNLKEASYIDVNIRDLNGRLLYSEPLGQQPSGPQKQFIDIPRGLLNNGLYLIEMASDVESSYLKLLIAE